VICERLDWGRTPYDAAMARMDARAAARQGGAVPDALVFVEHDPVVTLGRGSHRGHLLLPEAALQARGIAVRECGRGGDVTYHGPGQLVGYPILLLEPERRDAHRFLRDLEQALIEALADLGVAARRSDGRTGVWCGERKIASIGVRFSRWVTSHGFALNVARDVSGFDVIVPCGLPGVRMSSVERESGRAVSLAQAADAVERRFAQVFRRRMSAAAPVGSAAA